VGCLKATGLAGRWADVGMRGGGLWLAQKPVMGQSPKRNSFRISIDVQNLAEVWKIAQGDLGRNLIGLEYFCLAPNKHVIVASKEVDELAVLSGVQTGVTLTFCKDKILPT
jgi:hypothetical protein